MKIKMQVKIIKTGNVFNEEYDIGNNQNAKLFAENLIERFNNTLYPGESPRELVAVEVIEQDSKVLTNHSWEKQNSVTVIRGGSNYDVMRCRGCGITGKRHGLGGNGVKRDRKFKNKCYEKCETALAQIKKNKQ